MKYCSNCHRMSRDDDFCSHCGSAVYGDNSEADIGCSSVKGHEHEHDLDAQKYADMNRGVPPRSQQNTKPSNSNAAGGCIVAIVIMMLLLTILPVLGDLLSEMLSW